MMNAIRRGLACMAATFLFAACRPSPPDQGLSGRLRYAEADGRIWVEAHLLDTTLRVLAFSWDSLNRNTTRCEDWKIRKGAEPVLRALATPHLRPGYEPYFLDRDTLSHLALVVLFRAGDSTFLHVDNSDSSAFNRGSDSIRHGVIEPLHALFTSPRPCPEGDYLFLHPVPPAAQLACADTADPRVITPEEAGRYGYDAILRETGRHAEFPAHFRADPMTADNLTARLYPTPAGCRWTLVRTYRDGTFTDRRL